MEVQVLKFLCTQNGFEKPVAILKGPIVRSMQQGTRVTQRTVDDVFLRDVPAAIQCCQTWESSI